MGVLAVLTAAALWALTNLLVRYLTAYLGVVAINAYRATIGGLIFLGLALALHGVGFVAATPPLVLALLVGAGVGSLAVGDTLSFRAIQLIGVARAFPIAASYPLGTLVLAALLLAEPVGWPEAVGAVVTIAGVLLLALPAGGEAATAADGRARLPGILCALGAALLWAIDAVIFRHGLASVDVATSGAIALTAGAAVLWPRLGRRPLAPLRRLPARAAAALLAVGVLGTGVSAYLWLYAIAEIGAARAAILVSTAPLFAAPLAILFLGERPTRRVLLGTLLCVAGIALTTWSGVSG